MVIFVRQACSVICKGQGNGSIRFFQHYVEGIHPIRNFVKQFRVSLQVCKYLPFVYHSRTGGILEQLCNLKFLKPADDREDHIFAQHRNLIGRV